MLLNFNAMKSTHNQQNTKPIAMPSALPKHDSSGTSPNRYAKTATETKTSEKNKDREH